MTLALFFLWQSNIVYLLVLVKSHQKKPFDLIHCDIWGRYKYSSLSGAHYFLTIIDDYKRFTWIFLMKHKDEAQPVTPPTRHRMSSEGPFFFFKLITFKLAYSYNVEHLTCIIFCSSGLQNIYKLHIWKCSTFTIFTLFTK